MFVYDFDFPRSWTARFQDLLKPAAMQIMDEVERQIECELSGSDVLMLEPEPPAPAEEPFFVRSPKISVETASVHFMLRGL